MHRSVGDGVDHRADVAGDRRRVERSVRCRAGAVTAQLDDPYCLSGMHHWLANWQLRALEATTLGDPLREFGIREHAEAGQALEEFATLWRHGASPLLRGLIDAGTIELLGGPLSHPFQPLLNPRLREFALREGLADAGQRLAHTPAGIWAPECAYAPGMEIDYAAAGIGHFMVDGPSLHGDTALGRPVAASDVVAFGRDLQVSYRVWSPRSGYPGHAAYRDFHTYDHVTGLKPARVTGRNVASDAKAPYDPQRADHVVDVHVADQVNVSVWVCGTPLLTPSMIATPLSSMATSSDPVPEAAPGSDRLRLPDAMVPPVWPPVIAPTSADADTPS